MLFGPLGRDNLPIEKKRLPTLVWSFYALNCGQDMPEVTEFGVRTDLLGQCAQEDGRPGGIRLVVDGVG